MRVTFAPCSGITLGEEPWLIPLCSLPSAQHRSDQEAVPRSGTADARTEMPLLFQLLPPLRASISSGGQAADALHVHPTDGHIHPHTFRKLCPAKDLALSENVTKIGPETKATSTRLLQRLAAGSMAFEALGWPHVQLSPSADCGSMLQ